MDFTISDTNRGLHNGRTDVVLKRLGPTVLDQMSQPFLKKRTLCIKKDMKTWMSQPTFFVMPCGMLHRYVT